MGRIYMTKSRRRKVVILLSMLVLILVVGVVNNRLAEQDALTTSSDYVEYEQTEMDAHDGEVLVDSIQLTGVPGTGSAIVETSTDGAVQETNTDIATEDAAAVVITSDDIADLTDVTTYFNEIRATIDMDRSEILSMLTDVIAESGDGPEKNNATQQKLKIIEYMNTEKVMENLIENKGFTDALVIMTDTSVNVTVNKGELNQSDVAKIMDIVMRETNRGADQIVIQSKD